MRVGGKEIERLRETDREIHTDGYSSKFALRNPKNSLGRKFRIPLCSIKATKDQNHAAITYHRNALIYIESFNEKQRKDALLYICFFYWLMNKTLFGQ